MLRPITVPVNEYKIIERQTPDVHSFCQHVKKDYAYYDRNRQHETVKHNSNVNRTHCALYERMYAEYNSN